MTDDGRNMMRAESGALAALSQLALPVEVRLGSATLHIGELLRLRAGSVVALERGLDDPVELLVGERPVARAELVAIDDRIGVRIVEIIGGLEGPE